MTLLKRLLAGFLIAAALTAFVNWIATPLYHDGGNDYPVWAAFNWVMAVAVALTLAVNLARKVRLGADRPDGPVTRKHLEANLSFYASVVLAAWYYWNWFHSLFPENEPDLVGEIHLAAWVLINPLFTVLCGATGLYLLRKAKDSRPSP